MSEAEKKTEAEVSALVRDFECRTGVFGAGVGGIAIWQLMRFEVSLKLQGLHVHRAAPGRADLLWHCMRGFFQIFRLRKAGQLCKTFNSAYRRKTERGFEDIYFDDLRALLPNMAKMSSNDAAGYEQQVADAAYPPVFDDTSIVVLSAFLGRVFPVVPRHPSFNIVSQAVTSEFGLCDYSYKRIRRIYNVFWWRAQLYRLLLKRIRPDVVICPDSGQFSLMHAAEMQKIPYVEMQHGVFTQIHPNALPSDITNTEAEKILLPSVFAVYGQFSCDVLRDTRLVSDDRLRRVGAPFLERARAIREKEFKAGGQPRITVSTQGIAREALGSFILDFLDRCRDDMEFIVKLHPAYDQDEMFYLRLFSRDRRVIVDSGSSANSTYSYIARSDLHLSISSTCHYDALGIGTPTGILKLETYESVIDLLDVEGAFLVETPQDLARIVHERAWGVVPEETSRYFFERSFPEKMKETLLGIGALETPDPLEVCQP